MLQQLIIDNIDLWTSAETKRSTTGRGSNKKIELTGIKKLRELILELAVRGLLVPQDPNDEPARVLLGRIAVEKADLIKAGEIKKKKALLEVNEDEKPFELPISWRWQRLGDIGRDWGQKTPSDDFTYIDVSAIDNTRAKISSPNILEASSAPSRARKIVSLGTVIYSTVRPYLKNICVIEEELYPTPIASTAFAILHPLQSMPGKFFSVYLRSPVFINYVESVQTGIAYPAINDKQFFNGVVPIPPIAEQHRIVSKVDELMALCDQLEQQQTQHSGTHHTIVTTLLDSLSQASDDTRFQAIWSQLLANFDTLFTTEASIDQLKQTILQLAVMGKLVPQDPNDEPASVLLETIEAEKAQLNKDGKIKKQKPLSEITEDEKRFDLPQGWNWCRLQRIVHLLGDGLHGTPEYTPNERFYFVNGNNLKDGKIEIKPETKTVAIDQYELYKKNLGENTVLVSINGTLGNIAFYNNEDIVLGKSACYFNLASNINKKYIKILINSPQFIFYANQNATGMTIKNLGLKAMNHLPIALPSQNEQQRIVSKVDELMALCDQLKTHLNQAQTTQQHLAHAIVEQAVA